MTIDNRLIEKYAPATVGEQVHVNHEGCPAGTDTKRRLYIKRQADCILAYCHHCNEHRVLKSAGQRTLNQIKRALAYEQDGSSMLPVLPDDVVLYRDWSDAAKAQLMRYGLSAITTEHFGIMYSPSLGRIVFPYYDDCGNTAFVSQRLVEGETVGKKWLNCGVKPLGIYETMAVNAPRPNNIVLVEDPISAMKIARLTNWDAMCLHGTTMSDVQFSYIANLPAAVSARVWLDGDDAGKIGTHDIMKRLVPIRVMEPPIFLAEQDPKDCGSLELRKQLHGH